MDLELSELSCRCSLLEQDIQLHIRESLGFGQSKVAPNPAEAARACPEKTCFTPPIPRCRIKHFGHDDVSHKRADIVCDSGEDHSLDSKTR